MEELMGLLEVFNKETELQKIKFLLENNQTLAKLIYIDSIHQMDESVLFIYKGQLGKRLVITGQNSKIFQELSGEAIDNGNTKVCPLSVANSKVIRKYFSFTNPVSLANYPATIGLGDRLGLASPAHIRIVKKFKIRPVLAQQSMRELRLTGRDYADVLADAVWAVFQEDYQDGYGADGDHLKTAAEVRLALDNGFTMITLDCSEHIRQIRPGDESKIEKYYASLNDSYRQELEKFYLNQSIRVGKFSLNYTLKRLMENVYIYQSSLDFIIDIYHNILKKETKLVDLEISIDETTTDTEPDAHFFVANQLIKAGVKFVSLAPRFCGEFQKGVDYIGDIESFELQFREHIKIAETFGYKISIHSGSDKFSVFPIIGHESEGRFHLKTAGTNWLEALRVIVEVDPGLYREIHRYALDYFTEACKYYHVTANLRRIPPLELLSDEALKELLNQKDARQLLHITYGLILQATNSSGKLLFRERIYQCLMENEDLYSRFLQQHIGKHLRTLLYSVKMNVMAI